MNKYTVENYKEDFIKVWYKFDSLLDHLTEFVKAKRDVIDYSLSQPKFIKKGIENSSDDVKALLLRMFLKNNTNYNYLIVDKRVRRAKKKLMLDLEEKDNLILPVFKLFEYSKDRKGWKVVEDFEQMPIDERYILKVPLVLKYLFGYER